MKSKNGRTYVSVLVQESYRDPRYPTPRKRTLANITHLPTVVIDLIEKGIALLRDGLTPVAVSNHARPAADAVPAAFGTSLSWGGVAVALDAMQRSGMCAALACVPRTARPMVIAMIMQRLLQPGSTCSLVQWAPTTMVPEVLGIPAHLWNDDRIYRAMDALPARQRIIEQQLFARRAPGSVRMALYDVSSLYTHGDGCAVHRYGHSSDHREDRTQILIGLVTDAEGLPITLHILRGNRTSAASLVPCLRRMTRRFDLTHITIVTDNGFVSAANLAYLHEHGYGVITRLSRTTIAELVVLEEDTEAVHAEQAWDGHYLLLCTDADVADESIAASYKQLRKVEEDFKVVKSVLETRPVYHWKLRRIHGHLMVCFLALWLERWLTQRFTAAGVTTNVTTLLRDWQHIQRGVITVPGARVPLHTLTNLTEERRAQLEQVGLLKVVTQLTK